MSRPKKFIEQKLTRDFRNRVFAAVEPELGELRSAQGESPWWRLKYVSYAALACIAWVAGMQVFETESDESLIAELDILEFANEENLDDLEILMDLDPEELEFLLENELDGEEA